MKYLFTDFCILQAPALTEACTVQDVLYAMQRLCGYRPPLAALADALSALIADGLITVAGEPHAPACLRPDAPVQLTDAGRQAVTVSGVSRLLASLRERAERRLALAFCERERPVGAALPIDREAFGVCEMPGHWQGFILTEAENGLLQLAVQDDDTAIDDELDDISIAAVTTDPDAIRAAFTDLLDVAEGILAGNARTRKVALHGLARSLVLTFARAACEDEATALHVTAAPLRFNRKRFIGKRDGELDYAQCGDPILSAYWSPDPSALARALLPTVALSGPEVLDDALSARVGQLYRALN